MKIRAVERRKGCQQDWARKPGCSQEVVARGEQAIKITQQGQAGFDSSYRAVE
jgi:hypothetical protein